MDITVVQGDITAQDVDAVVNAANTRMRGGGGVDGAIHRAGGREVLEDCVRRFPHGLATGDAGWTTAGMMTARWVIHVVGPNHAAGQTDGPGEAGLCRDSPGVRQIDLADQPHQRGLAGAVATDQADVAASGNVERQVAKYDLAPAQGQIRLGQTFELNHVVTLDR